MMSIYRSALGALRILLVALCLSATTSHGYEFLPPLDQIDAFKVIQISGADVPEAIGENIENLSVAAVLDDEFLPIPFQIDEYNVAGAVYFEGWDVPLAGTKDVYDAEDRLLFMFKDAGPRIKPDQRLDGSLVAEIELIGKDGVKRYAYLMKDARLRSDEQYVRYSSELAKVETDFYSLTYDQENHLKWLEFDTPTIEGETLLDSMKIRISGGVLTSLAKINYDNEDLLGEPSGEVIGPIRSVTQLKVQLALMGVPFVDISLQLHHYPKAVLYDIRVMIPAVRRALFADPKLSLSIDGNNLIGAKVYTALGDEQGATVDGKIDDVEKEMIKSGITKDDTWIVASTKRNFDLVAYFDYLGEQRPDVSFRYFDSLEDTDPPERFKGQLPNAGYDIGVFPKSGFFGMVVSLYLNNKFSGERDVFTKDIRTAPKMVIRRAKTNKESAEP